ncbi:hypothetical protein AB0C52_12750 [Streptomyces sp. NPDC048717]|uniref:hypothetical protein n=1 Tax=Streptomyces sp. NPDC048717 TaxID=3154928 RepID=UPI00343EA7BE
MPISLTKPVRTFSVLHRRGEVLHVVPARARLQPDGSLGPYAQAWQDMFALNLRCTEVQAVDRWSAVREAADEIGPPLTEREWLTPRIDAFARANRSPNPSLPVSERVVVIDTVLESTFRPAAESTGAAIDWESADSEERRLWLASRPAAVLLSWYRRVRGIESPTVTPQG